MSDPSFYSRYFDVAQVSFEDLGLTGYKEAWDYQEKLFNSIIELKIANRKEEDSSKIIKTSNHLLFTEHRPVYTIGKSGKIENLLLSETELRAKEIEFYHNNRGGDITFHGPGQIVAYPILDLDYFFTDIHRYLRYLEQSVIDVCEHYGLKAGRIQGLTGVWIDPHDSKNPRKICAMGVKCSRWVTMHGLAFNVNTDMSYFDHIIPCGIDDKAVTSLEKELGHSVDIDEVKAILKLSISNEFNFDYDD